MLSLNSIIFPLNLYCDLVFKKNHNISALGLDFKCPIFSLLLSVKIIIELSLCHPLKTKSQYRFKGKIRELSDNKNYWDSLSEKSKSSWFWGSPGEKINPKVQSAHEILSNLPKSENFVVLNFEIDSVDLLKLEQPVHKRYLWEKIKKWEKVEINP